MSMKIKIIEPITNKIRYIGFCGLDDTICPLKVLLTSLKYPWIEWGFLFRSDLEGTARYISHETLKNFTELASNFPENSSKILDYNFKTLSPNYLELIDKINSILTKENKTNIPLNLAGHLCNNFCLDLLNKNDEILTKLVSFGFQRIQINPTKANGIELSEENLPTYSNNLYEIINKYKNKLEFILQFNDETNKLFNLVFQLFDVQLSYSNDSNVKTFPHNFALLNDSSCGLGILINTFNISTTIPCGFAGGIGPKTINDILENLLNSINNYEETNGKLLKPVWIDMESSLRTIQENSVDIFDLNKIQQVIDSAVENRFPVHHKDI